jgi:competence protein ComFC
MNLTNLPWPLQSLFETAARGGKGFLSLLYPPHCILCRAETAPKEFACAKCLVSIRPIVEPCCQVCSLPFDGTIENPFACSVCRAHKFHFESAAAALRSVGAARELIHQFKYNHQLFLRQMLADWLLAALATPRLQCPPPDGLVAVPLHPARQRERGFNQAHVLAKIAAQKTGIPLLSPLKRVRFTSTQTRLDREARIENLRNAFEMRQTVNVRNLHLILIDDVLTTGSTVNECARVLKAAGAASVRVAAVLRG